MHRVPDAPGKALGLHRGNNLPLRPGLLQRVLQRQSYLVLAHAAVRRLATHSADASQQTQNPLTGCNGLIPLSYCWRTMGLRVRADDVEDVATSSYAGHH